MQEDLYYPHPLIQDLIWDSLYIFMEPLLTHWPLNKLVREKALQVAMKHIHYEDENSRYITIGCVEKVVIVIIKGNDRYSDKMHKENFRTVYLLTLFLNYTPFPPLIFGQ